jgi:hypothetical protein
MSIIRFTINYRTTQQKKLEDFVDSYRLRVGIEIQELKIECYWKEAAQMQATFFTTTDLIRSEEKVFQILTMANILSTTDRHRWTFNGPHENGELIFGCILNNDIKDEPLTWACIELEDC